VVVSLISVTIFGGWIFAVITVLLFVALYKPVRFIAISSPLDLKIWQEHS
jgi:hypothetical protein